MLKLITPRTSAVDVRGVSVYIIFDPDMTAILRGFLESLTLPETWEQIPGYTVSVEDAVEAAKEMFQSFEDSL